MRGIRKSEGRPLDEGGGGKIYVRGEGEEEGYAGGAGL